MPPFFCVYTAILLNIANKIYFYCKNIAYIKYLYYLCIKKHK